MLGLEPRPPERLVGGRLPGRRRAGEPEVVRGVCAADRIRLVGCVEQPRRRTRGSSRASRSARRRRGRGSCRRASRARRVSAAHLVDGVERAAAREDGEAAEERPLVVVEELEAPADRVAQRSMPGRRIARPRGEKLERVLQPGEHRRRGQQLGPRRGELDRERQAVEVVADLRDRVPGRRRPPRSPGGRRGPAPGTWSTAASRRERLEGKLLLAAHAQPGAARDGDLQARARGDDRRQRRRGVDDLLEVVDDEQQPADPGGVRRGDARARPRRRRARASARSCRSRDRDP